VAAAYGTGANGVLLDRAGAGNGAEGPARGMRGRGAVTFAQERRAASSTACPGRRRARRGRLILPAAGSRRVAERRSRGPAMRHTVLNRRRQPHGRMDLHDAFESGRFGHRVCENGAEAGRPFATRGVRGGRARRAAARRDGLDLLTECAGCRSHKDGWPSLLSPRTRWPDRWRACAPARRISGKPYDSRLRVAPFASTLHAHRRHLREALDAATISLSQRYAMDFPQGPPSGYCDSARPQVRRDRACFHEGRRPPPFVSDFGGPYEEPRPAD